MDLVKEKYNKRKRTEYHKRKSSQCLFCFTITTRRFCNSKCQHSYNERKIFTTIENGTCLFNTEQTANRWYKRYLISKYGEKCMSCGWDKKHPVTGNVPIELEHADGNSQNNELSNLKLLCPNCHSLTPTFKALNWGKGRHTRRERYKTGKSF